MFRRVPAFFLCLFSMTAWGDDFRKSGWGATASEVLQQEEAEPLGRTELEQGGFRLTFVEDMFGQRAKIRYFFDPLCERLVRGSFAFAEPLFEIQFLMATKALLDIYGDVVQSNNLNGGDLSDWQAGATSIQFMHLPRGVVVAELADRPPTSITYWYAVEIRPSCEFEAD